MDESLEPPLRLPPGNPVGEIVWIAGGEVDECSVSLRFWSDDLVPDEVTDLLGINPTQSYKKGDIFRGKVYDRIRKVGFWVYPEMLNDDIKLYINNYTDSKKPKNVNITSSLQTNEHN
ncbi:hypothetical protein ACX27_09175 [Nostoc piscinale CENA21]|uniref:Uncharacterized protein n=1 Tax=Nostoc piscinale CENA21 TaxID=224013 RepID=A0A0M4SWC0_9NOSO|nr:DUF4279 domain-containing protein [Nostoc piscinale]ALF52984.1 hypothetical protein ACX27_09175 [Nostoc piscinale CENA21]